MNIFFVLSITIFAVIIAAYLKKNNHDISLVFSISVIVLISVTTIENIFPIIDKISSYNITDEIFLSIPLKILGLTILSKITTSVCDDAGEKGISSAVSVITKVAAMLIALPLFDKLLEQVAMVLTL